MSRWNQYTFPDTKSSPKDMPVKDQVDELKKMLGPLGGLHSIEFRYAVLVRDTAGNVLRLLETLKQIEELAPKKP